MPRVAHAAQRAAQGTDGGRAFTTLCTAGGSLHGGRPIDGNFGKPPPAVPRA